MLSIYQIADSQPLKINRFLAENKFSGFVISAWAKNLFRREPAVVDFLKIQLNRTTTISLNNPL